MNIVVVGGGVIGLSCAWRLGLGPARVMVVERRECGAGATLASLGALWPPGALARGALQQWHRECLRKFPAFVRELEEASGVRVPTKRGGRWEILTSAEARERAHREAETACVEWKGWPEIEGRVQAYVGPEEVERQLGLDAPFGALRCEATGQVHVASLVRSLVLACQAAGVDIRERTEVKRVIVGGERVRGVETAAEGFVPADAVVLCSGAWTSALVADDSVVRPAKGQGIALGVRTGDAPGGIIKRGPIYLVPWGERGEVLVGSTTEPEAGFDEAPTEVAAEMLEAGAKELWPGLRGAAVLRRWAGLRPDGPKHRPVMGESHRVGGLWICAGHYKTGIGMAGETGELMAGAIVRGDPLPRF
ncbi:MAG TPA: FAD-dependent oxidoreductase [Phycisphaerae bacterium]|nr:FAD-dependent oxidoreductase [Phycisphaerae bacterium]